MGWTSYHLEQGRTAKQECDRMLAWENDRTKNTVVKSRMVGSTYYAAVRTDYKDGVTASEVWAAVFLTSRYRPDDFGTNFRYKDMDETAGPCESECPASILDLLTPTKSEWANAWRERCRANIAKKKNKPKVGDVIVLKEPIKFRDGASLNKFKVVQYKQRGKTRTTYASVDNGGWYRLGPLHRLEFTVESLAG